MTAVSRRTFAALGLFGAAVLATGCSGGRTAGRKRITASFHNMAEPFFVVMRRELVAEAERLGVDVDILDGQANSAKQSADIEAALVRGVDGVIIAPTDVNALAPAVNSVLAQNIPIITVDRRIESTKQPVPHVGADNVAGGASMIDWVVANHPDGARIVLLTGQPGSSSSIDRTTGIKGALAKAGGKYNLVAEQSANWSRDQGLTVTQNILTGLGNNRPHVIVAENDDMGFGAVEALRTAGITGVPVLGFDATPEALRLIKAGTMAATVEQSPSRQIKAALAQILASTGGQAGMQSVKIEPLLIAKSNLDKAERISEI